MSLIYGDPIEALCADLRNEASVYNDSAITDTSQLLYEASTVIQRLSYALSCIANENWKDMTAELARDLARAALAGDSHD